MKGSRLQAISRKLQGEKIEVIEWSADDSVFAANALTPAKVKQVIINEHFIEAIVYADELQSALGRRGQNLQLAEDLVGKRIEVRTEEEINRDVTD